MHRDDALGRYPRRLGPRGTVVQQGQLSRRVRIGIDGEQAALRQRQRQQLVGRVLTLVTRTGIALIAVGVALMVARGVSPLDPAPRLDPAAIPEALKKGKPGTKEFRVALRDAAGTDPARPISWVRLEPSGEHADVRLTMLPGGPDEVLAVGDAQFQKKCLGKMEDVAHQGRTVLFVSHNMSAVRALCSDAILLERGKIVPSRITAVSAKKQRELAQAIKRARFLGLLPYVIR